MSSIKLKCIDNSGNNIFLVDSNNGILGTNTIESTNSTTGAFSLSGGISIGKTSNSSSITAGGALTIAGGASFAKDVHIGGNLTVYGSQTQIISQIVRIQDNLLVVNATPNTGRDGGILFQRYQLENDTGIGDVIQDTPFLSSYLISATNNTIIFPPSSSSINDYYNGCFVKITSGTGVNQIRRITQYNGSTKTATLNSVLTIIPSVNDTIFIYNKIYAAYYYSEQSDNFILGWTTTDDSDFLTVSDYIGLKSGYISIQDTQNSIGIGSGGSFTTLGGASISKNLYVGQNVTIANSLSVDSINCQTQNVLNTIVTNSTFTNALLSNSTTTNLVNTSLTSSNLFSTNITSSQIFATHVTLSNLYITSNVTAPSLFSNNLLFTNGTVSSLTGSSININGNTNTIGNIFTTDGNIGIGTTSPTQKLDVNGNLHVSSNLYISGIVSNSSGSIFSYMTLTSTDDAINLTTGSILTYGGITIRSSTDATSLTNGGSILVAGGASVYKKLFVGNGLVSSNNSNTIGNIFTTDGNVGIGTINPSISLDVNGSLGTKVALAPWHHIYLTHDQSRAMIRAGGATQGLSLDVNTSTTGSYNNDSYTRVMTLLSSGNVGIGTTTPSKQLHVKSFSSNSIIAIDAPFANQSAIEFFRDGSRKGAWYREENTDDVRFWSDVANTNIITFGSTGNVGIGTTSPYYGLQVEKNTYLVSNTRVANNNISNVSGGTLNINGDVIISGTAGIFFTTNGLNAPTTTSRSLGTKLVLYPSLSANDVDYAIGVNTNTMWASVQNQQSEFKWYQGTREAMSILGNATVTVHSTENAIGTTGGSLVVKGGALIEKDTRISGLLFVNGQNLSSIMGIATIGSFSGTGVYTLNNVSIGTTMNNTNYKIIGNLKTTTDISNVYTVSFKRLTTTTFDIVIYRIDSLGSGWTDNSLCLSWQITP